MGNSDSQYCDMCNTGDKDRSSSYDASQDADCLNMTPSVPKPDKKNGVGSIDQRFPENDEHTSDHPKCNLFADEQAQLCHTPIQSNLQQNSHDFDPRSPTVEISRTPIVLKKSSNVEDMLNDPRSPTVGIERTPIVAGDEKKRRFMSVQRDPVVHTLAESTNTLQNLVDPRSPTAEIVRTPLKFTDDVKAPSFADLTSQLSISNSGTTSQMSSTPLTESTNVNENSAVSGDREDLADPRSPTAELSRTPIRASSKDNLRRKVLLSNAHMTSPNSDATQTCRDQENVVADGCASEMAKLSVSQPPEGALTACALLDISCASNLNVSQSSSVLGVCGSDPAGASADELEEDGDEMINDSSLNVEHASWPTDVVEELAGDSEERAALLNGHSDNVVITPDAKSAFNDCNMQTPEEAAESCTECRGPVNDLSPTVATETGTQPSVEADEGRENSSKVEVLETKTLGEQRTGQRKKPLKSTSKSSIPVPTMKRSLVGDGKHSKKPRKYHLSSTPADLVKQQAMSERQTNRSPFAVLGHRNSPEIRLQQHPRKVVDGRPASNRSISRSDCGKEN